MGNKPYRNGIMNAPLKCRAPVRSPPSTKVSAKATGGITKAATVGIENWFERGQLPLSSSVREYKLLQSSASNMMAVKHLTKSTNAKNAVKAAAPVLLAITLRHYLYFRLLVLFPSLQ